MAAFLHTSGTGCGALMTFKSLSMALLAAAAAAVVVPGMKEPNQENIFSCGGVLTNPRAKGMRDVRLLLTISHLRA